jgi:hypothetical protein
MQKVVGSNPIIRSIESPAPAGFSVGGGRERVAVAASVFASGIRSPGGSAFIEEFQVVTGMAGLPIGYLDVKLPPLLLGGRGGPADVEDTDFAAHTNDETRMLEMSDRLGQELQVSNANPQFPAQPPRSVSTDLARSQDLRSALVGGAAKRRHSCKRFRKRTP